MSNPKAPINQRVSSISLRVTLLREGSTGSFCFPMDAGDFPEFDYRGAGTTVPRYAL